jgi:hypothetical protein
MKNLKLMMMTLMMSLSFISFGQNTHILDIDSKIQYFYNKTQNECINLTKQFYKINDSHKNVIFKNINFSTKNNNLIIDLELHEFFDNKILYLTINYIYNTEIFYIKYSFYIKDIYVNIDYSPEIFLSSKSKDERYETNLHKLKSFINSLEQTQIYYINNNNVEIINNELINGLDLLIKSDDHENVALITMTSTAVLSTVMLTNDVDIVPVMVVSGIGTIISISYYISSKVKKRKALRKIRKASI